MNLKVHYVEVSGYHGGEYEGDCLRDVAPCSLLEVSDVLEVLAASTFRAMVLTKARHLIVSWVS
jgi:hypothetical protein